jgi:xanthine dehydrogenase molybdopterin-binding subunit B
MEGVTYGDTGAYSSLGIYIIKKIALHLGGPYFYPNYKADSFSAYTNNPISGPFRGFGVFQAAIVHEAQMDELAGKLGMDPLAFRLKNCLRPGLTTATGQLVTEACGTPATLERLQPEIVFANEDEAALVGTVESATLILKRGAGGIAVGEVEYEARPAEIVDTTGAGDALAAGFLLGGPEVGLYAAARCVATMGAFPQ